MMVFGEYEYRRINAADLVVLPQVRKGKNDKLEELIDSIQDKGLINPMDIAQLTYEELAKHIGFLNQLWKKNVNIDTFRAIDGFYYVVIAGHSRLLAIQEIGKREHCECFISGKIHRVHTSEDILAIQLDENIHSEPRIEERAIAIIETYKLGILNGSWSNREAFIRKNQHKFSRRVLGDAVAFSNLPVDVQEFIFINNIKYAVGVELGRCYPLVERYITDKLAGGDGSKELTQEQLDTIIPERFEKSMDMYYGILTMKLQKAGSVKRALAILSAECNSLVDYFRPKEEVQQEMFEEFMRGAERQGEMYYLELLKEYNKLWDALTDLPFTYYQSLAHLETTLTGVNHDEDIRNVQKLHYQHALRRFDRPKK